MGLLSFLFGCRNGDGDESAYYKKDGHWFYAGVQVPVETGHVNFKPLNTTFARDDLTAYDRGTPIDGSDGATFVALNLHYAKDKSTVYSAKLMDISAIKGARVESFKALDDGYATDGQRAYHGGVVITRDDAASLEYLSMGYAKTARQVFFQGKPVPDADAPSFAVAERPGDAYDAADKSGAFSSGIRVRQPAR